MVIVFKASDNIKEMMIKHYNKYKKDKTPPYAIFQAVEADTVVTLYESGKVMFQGVSADIDASIWISQEKRLNNRIIDLNKNDKKDKKETKEETKKGFMNISTIGSDEVGTGDYFGPIVVSATYVSKDDIPALKELGVRDSKKIDDTKIKEIAPLIIKKIPYVTFILDNKSYNNLSSDDKNMNKIKAILHNKVLCGLIKKGNYQYNKIVIDQFVYPKKFYEHISKSNEKISNVTFMTKAEDQVMSVACASIISRYIFLKEMKKMNDELGIIIPLGASTSVDEAAKMVVNKFGSEKLNDVVKLNFKNTQRIM